MASEGSFKQYARGNRSQVSDETFKDGQVFTRAPLSTGKARLLTNYDIINDGEALRPRRGYRTTELAVCLASTGLAPTLTSDVSITQAKEVVEEDSKHYTLAIANTFPADATAIESNLYAAYAEMWVTNTDNAESYSILDEYGIATREMYAIPVSYVLGDTNKPKSYYTIPKDPTVHGIKITNPEYLAKPVGCFAFTDNDYYNFNTSGELIRTKYSKATETTTATYLMEKLDPKSLDPSEAANYGFNMLSTTPFTFSDAYTSGTIQLTGMFIYDSSDTFVAYPKLNTKYKFRFFYKVEKSKTYKFIIQYKETNAEEWNDIETREVTFSDDEPKELSITEFSSPHESITFRVQAYVKSSSGSYSEYPEKTGTYSAAFSTIVTDSAANTDIINYDITKCKGMVYWKNHLWIYGVLQDPSILFCSDINEPTYFPYPNNILLEDEAIIAVVPFNEYLLIFTKTQVIQLTLGTDTLFTTKVIQSNLNFEDIDARFIQVVKNMVYFKSGEYYYMIVPKTLSLQNELAIAPVSKNIEYFLDEFKDNIADLLETLYDYTGDINLINHYDYLNYEDVHNVYVFKLDDSSLINVVLLYNTVDRVWRIYTYESETPYYPLKIDATKTCKLLTPAYLKLNKDSTVTSTIALQTIEIHRTNVVDFYIPKDSILKYANSTWLADGGVIETAFNKAHKWHNWQLIDTGYRDNSLDYKKRFRELQLKFNNIDFETLNFYTEFILDGETRVSRFKYTTEHIIDESNPNYGLIYISRTAVENIQVPGNTILADADDVNLNYWQLSTSKFPETAFWKARLKVSGKGYTPRFRLICKSEQRYELLGYSWVYRLMYSR